MTEWNRDTKWRQGHLLTGEAIRSLGLSHDAGQEQTLVIVASHDCDIAQPPQSEPYVEVIVGYFSAEKKGNFCDAKNPRIIQMEFAGAPPLLGEFESIKKVSVFKTDLIAFRPRNDVCLTPEELATFQMWLALRYRRSAFPEEFENRLKRRDLKLDEKISRAVGRHGELIEGVFFDVDGGHEVARVGPDDTYTLDIIVLHKATLDFAVAMAGAEDAVERIKAAFKNACFDPNGKWQDIELRNCEVISESVLTYDVFKLLKRWRLEHMSLAAEPQQDLPPP